MFAARGQGRLRHANPPLTEVRAHRITIQRNGDARHPPRHLSDRAEVGWRDLPFRASRAFD